MIRLVALASMLSLLCLVLYLPAANPAARFLAQIHTEHQALQAFWGEAQAQRVLARAQQLQAAVQHASPVPAAGDAPATAALGAAVAQEMARVNQRLFNSAYFRSVDALLALAAYRLSTVLEWLPWLVAIAAAAVVDGVVARRIKSATFRAHDPELFAVYACLAIGLACAGAVGAVLPVTVPAVLVPATLIAMAVLAGRAVGSFHRRG